MDARVSAGEWTPEIMREARAISKPYMDPNPVIYWTDFLLSAALGWSTFIGAALAPAFSPLQIGLAVIASFALFRAVLFTHELAHLKKGTFGVFRFVWNALAGVPLLIPSFAYTGVHIDHHRPGVYGSTRDGEYVSFGAGKPWRSVVYVLLSVFLPPLLVLRFGILTPISYLVPPLRKLLWQRFSSLAIDFGYVRHDPNEDDDATWRLQEFAAFVFALTMLVLLITGIMPMTVIYLWYTVTVTVLIVNALRTLAAHAYRHLGDVTVSRAEEFMDSVNIPGTPFFTPLWAPVGLRFHATHHLFPAAPYHHLPKLHAALVADLSDNTAYLSASRKNLAHAIWRLWQDAAAADARMKAGAETESLA